MDVADFFLSKQTIFLYHVKMLFSKNSIELIAFYQDIEPTYIGMIEALKLHWGEV